MDSVLKTAVKIATTQELTKIKEDVIQDVHAEYSDVIAWLRKNKPCNEESLFGFLVQEPRMKLTHDHEAKGWTWSTHCPMFQGDYVFETDELKLARIKAREEVQKKLDDYINYHKELPKGWALQSDKDMLCGSMCLTIDDD